jgi:hypothetical protein
MAEGLTPSYTSSTYTTIAYSKEDRHFQKLGILPAIESGAAAHDGRRYGRGKSCNAERHDVSIGGDSCGELEDWEWQKVIAAEVGLLNIQDNAFRGGECRFEFLMKPHLVEVAALGRGRLDRNLTTFCVYLYTYNLNGAVWCV